MEIIDRQEHVRDRPARPLPHISSRRIARNTTWNLLGTFLPMSVGLLCMPLLIRYLGMERFGVLGIAWTLTGYMSLFDLGLGRALTQMVSRSLGNGDYDSIGPIFRTAILAMAVLGVAAAALLYGAAGYLAGGLLHVPVDLRPEVETSLRILSLSVPLMTLASGTRAFLEAWESFFAVNCVRFILGVLGFIGPLLVSIVSPHLPAVMASLVVARAVVCLAYGWACVRLFPSLLHSAASAPALRRLMTFGGWVTVSNLVSPLMVNMDRFFIAAYLSLSAVSSFIASSELITRALLFPACLVAALYPTFGAIAASASDSTRLLYVNSVKMAFWMMFPIVLVLGTFSRELLALWLGPRIAQDGYAVLSLLCLGALVNPSGQAAVALLHALGRARVTATFHLIELPVYVILLVLLTPRLGLTGVAVAWSTRIVLDSFLLFYAAQKSLRRCAILDRRVIAATFCAVTTIAGSCAGISLALRASAVAAILILYIAGLYRRRRLLSRNTLTAALTS